MQESGCHGNQKKNFKNFLVSNHWTDFNIIYQKYFFGDLNQDCSSHHVSSKKKKKKEKKKNIATSGQGLFSLYIYIENVKNHLVRNHLNIINNFNYTK